MTDVTLITGDGIGPEIAEATRRCVDATGAGIKTYNIIMTKEEIE